MIICSLWMYDTFTQVHRKEIALYSLQPLERRTERHDGTGESLKTPGCESIQTATQMQQTGVAH
jgi:hypothetical protein